MTETNNVRTVPKGTGLLRVWRAVFYSLHGLASCYKNESAFRQEVMLAAMLLPFAAALPLDLTAKLWLISSVWLVLIVELLNSAVEWVVDLASTEHHLFGKRAKDMGSAAVLLSILHLLTAWCVVLTAGWEQVLEWMSRLW